jgi:hypothetical protein
VFDGQSPPPGVAVDGAGVGGWVSVPAVSQITWAKPQSRDIAAELHTNVIERVVGRTWPAKESQVVRLELMH